MSVENDPSETALASALERLGVRSSLVYAAQPIPTGLSTARLWRVTLREPLPSGASRWRRRVVKLPAPPSDWLAAASGDPGSRESRLWSSGLLRDRPRLIETGVIADTRSNTSDPAALFMRDETAHLLRSPLRSPPGRLPDVVRRVVDRLARLHAHFWMDARLRDPDLGLMSTRSALLLLAPATIAERLRAGETQPYLPLADAGWRAFFARSSPQTARRLHAVFDEPAPIVAAIDRLPYTLVHGDVWGPNLGWLPGTRVAPRDGHRLLLLDWALAATGPCTYDPLWLCGTWHALDPTRVLAAYRARLTRHLAARGVRVAPPVWRALVDAGYLRTALTCGEALGRAAAEASPGRARRRAEWRMRWWADRAALAAQRLSSGDVLA